MEQAHLTEPEKLAGETERVSETKHAQPAHASAAKHAAHNPDDAGLNLDLEEAIEGEDALIDKGTAHTMGRTINLVLCAIAFVVLFGYLFIAGEGEDTLNAIARFNWVFLFLTLIGVIIYWLLEAVCMQLICDKLFTGFSFGKTFLVTIIGQYFNCITPLSSGGQPMQAYYYQRFGLPLDKAMPMLLCRFIAYQMTVIVYAVIVLVLRFTYFTQDLRAIMYLVVIGFFGGFVLIAMLLALAFARGPIMKATMWSINLLGRIGVLKQPDRTRANATKSLEDAYHGIRYLLKEPVLLAKVAGVTFVQLTVFFSLSFLIFWGFGMPEGDYLTVLSCQAFIYLIASFVPLPGAMGATEACYVTFFNYVYGNASVVALSTFVWRALTFYLPIVLGMILTLLVNNPNTALARWIAKDDARLAAEAQERAAREAAESAASGAAEAEAVGAESNGGADAQDEHETAATAETPA